MSKLPSPYRFKNGDMTQILNQTKDIDATTGTFTRSTYVCVEMSDRSKHWEFVSSDVALQTDAPPVIQPSGGV
ncbi:MAG: hypothetical protein ACK5QB_20120 [Pseudanabaena sp.]|jgi:hypothetical protein